MKNQTQNNSLVNSNYAKKEMKYITLFLSLVLIGCATPEYQSVPTYMSSKQIQEETDASLSERLNNDIEKFNSSVEIHVNHYNVLLIGTVQDKDIKEQIYNRVRHNPVVKNIYNYINVGANGCSFHNRLSGQILSNMKIHNDIDTSQVSIASIDDKVYIMGTDVGNLTAVNDFINSIYTMNGVNSVINLIQNGSGDYYAEH